MSNAPYKTVPEDLEGSHYEEVLYEGHAPGGGALVMEVTIDNKNRTAADLRFILSKIHGSFAAIQMVRFYEALEEECDDTQNVPANFDIPEDILARLAA